MTNAIRAGSAARAAYTEATRIYTDLGATWDLLRAETRLRPYRLRRNRPAVRNRPTSGWEALTPDRAEDHRLRCRALTPPNRHRAGGVSGV